MTGGCFLRAPKFKHSENGIVGAIERNHNAIKYSEDRCWSSLCYSEKTVRTDKSGEVKEEKWNNRRSERTPLIGEKDR